MAPALLTSGPDALLGGRPWALEEDNASLASTHPMPVVPLSCDSQKRLRTLSGVGRWMGAKLRPPESHCPECTHLVMNPSAPPVWQVGKADLDWMNPLGQLGLQHCGEDWGLSAPPGLAAQALLSSPLGPVGQRGPRPGGESRAEAGGTRHRGRPCRPGDSRGWDLWLDGQACNRMCLHCSSP